MITLSTPAIMKYNPDKDPIVDDILGVKKEGKDPSSSASVMPSPSPEPEPSKTTAFEFDSVLNNIKSDIISPAKKCFSLLEGHKLIEDVAGTINNTIEPGQDTYGLMNIVKGMEKGVMTGNRMFLKYYGKKLEKIRDNYLSNIYPTIPEEQKEHPDIIEANEIINKLHNVVTDSTPLRFKKFKK